MGSSNAPLKLETLLWLLMARFGSKEPRECCSIPHSPLCSYNSLISQGDGRIVLQLRASDEGLIVSANPSRALLVGRCAMDHLVKFIQNVPIVRIVRLGELDVKRREQVWLRRESYFMIPWSSAWP